MFELRVLNGLHEGAAIPLTGESWSLGNDEQNDLQLCDEAIKSLHARLRKTEQLWELMPGEGDVYLSQGKAIRETLSLDLNQPFQLSGVWLVVSDADSPWQKNGLIPLDKNVNILTKSLTGKFDFLSRFAILIRPLIILFCLLLIGLAVAGFWSASKVEPKPQNLKPVLYDAEGLRAVVDRKLQERDLSSVVKVEGDHQGVWLVGSVTQIQSDIINRLMILMNKTYSIKIPFVNRTTLKVLSLPFRIVQITAGKGANVVIDNGKRLFIGDREGDFTLSRITKTAVEFTGPQNITVKW